MGLEVQGKIITRRKRQQELCSDANEKNIFFYLCEIWGFQSRVADSCTRLRYGTIQMDNRISKFPANTMLLSSRRVEIPNRRRYMSFRLLKTRKGRFFETLRSNYPKIQHHIPEERNPSIPLLIQMGTWSPLCAYKTCTLHSYLYQGMQEISLRWKRKNLGGVQQLLVPLQARTICNSFPTKYDCQTQGIVVAQVCHLQFNHAWFQGTEKENGLQSIEYDEEGCPTLYRN
jgi:hypothetical protein